MSINSSIPTVEAIVKDNGTDLSAEKTIRKNVAIDVSFNFYYPRNIPY